MTNKSLLISLLVSVVSLRLAAFPDPEAEPVALDASGDPLPPGAIARLGTMRFRPGGPLRFSEDGKTILVADSFGNTIYLRDGFTGMALRRFEVRGRPQLLTFSPDCKTVALIDRSGGAKEIPGIVLRDIATGKKLAHLPTGYCKAVLWAGYAPDGDIIATATTDPQIVIWHAATGKKVRALPMEGRVMHAAFDKAGKTLRVELFKDGMLGQEWEIATGKKIRTLPPFEKEFRSVTVSPDGNLLVLRGNRGATNLLMVADAAGKELYRRVVVFGFHAFSSSGELLAIAERDGAIILDARTGKQRGRIKGFVHGIFFSPDGRRIASNVSAGSIGLWDVASGRDLHPLAKGHGGPIRNLAFSPDGKTLYASGMRLISAWDVEKRESVQRWGDESVNAARKWDFLTNGRLIGSSTKDGVLQLWDPATGKERDRLNLTGPAVGLDLSPDGKTLAIAVAKEIKDPILRVELQLWDARTKEIMPRPPFELRPLVQVISDSVQVAFSPDGKRLAVNDHNQVLLWDVGTDKKPKPLLGAAQHPWVLRFSPDGRLLAGACDRNCLVWNVATGTEYWKMSFKGIPEPAFDDPAYWLGFSADGSTLLIAHWGAIRFWELATREERWTLNHGGRTFALSPDQSLLATGDDSSAILLWDMKRLGLKAGLEKLTPDQLRGLWADLNGKARPAFVAIERMVVAPEQAVPFLAESMRYKPVDPGRLANLIRDLDSPKIVVRDRAMGELRELGATASDRLQTALSDSPRPETRRRLEELLKQSSIREVRAVEILERIGNPGSMDLLGVLARNFPSAGLRQQANEAAVRAKKRALKDN